MGIDFKKASRAALRRNRNPLTGKQLPKSPFAPKPAAGRVPAHGAAPVVPGMPPAPEHPTSIKPPRNLNKDAKVYNKNKKKDKATTPRQPSAPRGSGSAPRAAVSSPPSASNPSSGAGAASVRAHTTKMPPGNKGGGKTGGKGGGSTAPVSAPNPVTPTEDDPITGLYAAANRDLERRRQLNDATRLARLEDQKKFDDWVAAQRGSADQTLKDAFAKSAADAQAARAQSYDMINKYATEATRQASGVAGLLTQAGADADKASFGFQSQGDAVSNAGGAFNQAAFSQLQNQQKDVDRARAANMVASYNAQNFAAQQKLAEEGASLKVNEMKDRISQRNADRQYILDQQAAEFLQGLKQDELGVKKYAAETDRIVGKLNAEAKVEANRIRSELAAGTLTLKRADLQLKRKNYSLAERKQILAESQAGVKRGNKLRQDASTFINKWNSDNLDAQGLPAAPQGDAGIAYARSAVGALKSRWPGLKAKDAVDMLRAILPGDVINDDRVLSAIAGSFR